MFSEEKFPFRRCVFISLSYDFKNQLKQLDNDCSEEVNKYLSLLE